LKMGSEQKRVLMRELWNIADLLRGKMRSDEYKNYILGFIFYKYLSEKQEIYVNEELGLVEELEIGYLELDKTISKYDEYIREIEDASMQSLGFFVKPNELFNYLVEKANRDGFIIEDLQKAISAIEKRRFGKESEEDFIDLFEDVDLTSPKLGKSEKEKNSLIIDIFKHLARIDFDIRNPKSDILGDAYEYLIGEFAAGAGKKGVINCFRIIT